MESLWDSVSRRPMPERDANKGWDDKLREECGIFAIQVARGQDLDPALETYYALFALQHRGQQSAGIAVSTGKELICKKGDGLVLDNFDDRALLRMRGRMAMGHVRYSSGSAVGEVNAGPMVAHHLGGFLAVAFNGALTNAKELKRDSELRGGIFQTDSHAEIITHLIVQQQLHTDKLEEAVAAATCHMKGAFSIVVMNANTMVAARDPYGFRPLCLGKLGDSVVFSSETCALNAVSASFVRDIAPGEVVAVKDCTVRSLRGAPVTKGGVCVFEHIYFARPDSIVDGQSVEHARQMAGRCLARRNTAQADVVVGVPDSGLSAALGFAKESGIPYEVGMLKNRYIGRTFIQPSQTQRQKAISIKLNALSTVVKGKRVVLVDDSIVRGTTCSYIVNLLRSAGAAEVHLKIASPPFLHPCYFGTDVPAREFLMAYNHTRDEMVEMIGVDSLQYLEQEDLPLIVPDLRIGFCQGCFTGEYPVSQKEMQKEGEDL